jgi:methionyl-tRNA formyltransferase
MKIVLFSNGSNLTTLYTVLKQHNYFHALVIPGVFYAQLAPVIDNIKSSGYPVYAVADELQSWQGLQLWLTENRLSLAITFGFPYRVPGSVLDAIAHGAYNIHFSLLPGYRGPNPLFWQLKNNEKKTAVSIHRMTSQLDRGPIIAQQETDIFPGETFGLLGARLSFLAIQLLLKLIPDILDDKVHQVQNLGGSYYKRPAEHDVTINWARQEAEEIEGLVNACNPSYNGAITYLNNQQIRIVEVTPADVQQEMTAQPGTVVHADKDHGVFVACRNNKYLRINILYTNDGLMTGFKLAALGLSAGLQFEDIREN